MARLALDHGVNHLDIAPQYGAAESVVGPNLAAHRDELFIAGKTLRANPDGVTRPVRHHPAPAQRRGARPLPGPRGDVAARSWTVVRPRSSESLRFRDAGHTRFAGITGHDLEVPRAHLEALRRFDLDTVMFPVYPALWARPEYREPAEELLAVCAERDIGVMAIKAVARRPWADRRPMADAVAGRPPRPIAGRRRGTSRSTATRRWTGACTSPSPFPASTPSARRVTSRCCRGSWPRPSASRR